ncbi:MAG: hypothetical protein AAGF07_02970 [Patescibacteria group bacterium]
MHHSQENKANTSESIKTKDIQSADRALKILINPLAKELLTEFTIVGQYPDIVDSLIENRAEPAYANINQQLISFATNWNILQYEKDLSSAQRKHIISHDLKILSEELKNIFGIDKFRRRILDFKNKIMGFDQSKANKNTSFIDRIKSEKDYNQSDWNPKNDLPDWGDEIDAALYREFDKRVQELRRLRLNSLEEPQNTQTPSQILEEDAKPNPSLSIPKFLSKKLQSLRKRVVSEFSEDSKPRSTYTTPKLHKYDLNYEFPTLDPMYGGFPDSEEVYNQDVEENSANRKPVYEEVDDDSEQAHIVDRPMSNNDYANLLKGVK